MRATVSSNARCASPAYTPPKPSRAQANSATWYGPAPAKPGGHTSTVCSSGMNAWSRIVSCDAVARMPSVSHVSTMR